MNEKENILANALEKLEEYTPIKAKWKIAATADVDGILQLTYNRKTYPFTAGIKDIIRHDHIKRLAKMAKPPEAYVVVARHIPAGVKKALQKEGVNYLEANGNIFIRQNDMLIIIDNNDEAPIEKPTTNRAFMKTGLKAVFYLLNHPEAANDNYRKLAADTNMALGNVKYTMDGLREANFLFNVDKKTVRLRNMKGLLERWLIAYREILKPTLLLGTYNFDKLNNSQKEWRNIDIQKALCLWGGEPAADILTNYLRPQRFQLYTNQHKIQIMLSLRILPNAKGEGEIELYQQFWDQKYYQDFDNCVPPLLIYTDLVLTDDPRCAEAAQLIYDLYLKENVERYQ